MTSATVWTGVLRLRPVGIVEGRAQGSYTNAFEIICCDCGDHPDRDCRHVSAELQRIRGPFPMAAGVTAYEEHLKLHPPAGADHPRWLSLRWRE